MCRSICTKSDVRSGGVFFETCQSNGNRSAKRGGDQTSLVGDPLGDSSLQKGDVNPGVGPLLTKLSDNDMLSRSLGGEGGPTSIYWLLSPPEPSLPNDELYSRFPASGPPAAAADSDAAPAVPPPLAKLLRFLLLFAIPIGIPELDIES